MHGAEAGHMRHIKAFYCDNKGGIINNNAVYEVTRKSWSLVNRNTSN